MQQLTVDRAPSLAVRLLFVVASRFAKKFYHRMNTYVDSICQFSVLDLVLFIHLQEQRKMTAEDFTRQESQNRGSSSIRLQADSFSSSAEKVPLKTFRIFLFLSVSWQYFLIFNFYSYLL